MNRRVPILSKPPLDLLHRLSSKTSASVAFFNHHNANHSPPLWPKLDVEVADHHSSSIEDQVHMIGMGKGPLVKIFDWNRVKKVALSKAASTCPLCCIAAFEQSEALKAGLLQNPSDKLPFAEGVSLEERSIFDARAASSPFSCA